MIYAARTNNSMVSVATKCILLHSPNGIVSSFLSIASKFLFTSNISAAYSLPFSRILTLKYNVASKFLFTSNISAAYSLPFSRILTLKYNVLKYQGISN